MPTVLDRLLRLYRITQNTTGDEVQQAMAAPESGIKDQSWLIEPQSFRQVHFRIIIEIEINFTVGHAARLALMAKDRPPKKCDISEVVINVAVNSPHALIAAVVARIQNQSVFPAYFLSPLLLASLQSGEPTHGK